MEPRENSSFGLVATPGDDGAQRRVADGMFMTLSMILLTLMIYLFSLAIPDTDRRQLVYASLAKAFLFEGEVPVTQARDSVLLLSDARIAVRELEAHLAGRGATDAVSAVDGDLVVGLDNDLLFGADGNITADGAVTLSFIAQVAAHGSARVRVAATASAGEDARAASMSRAVAAAAALAAGRGIVLDPRRIEAVGLGAPVLDEAPRMSFVIVDGEGML